MNSQEIVDYVMNTPNNTNPIILKQMIDANSSGGGSTSVARDPDDMSREEMIAFAKQLKPFWTQDDDDGMILCNQYKCRFISGGSADACDPCCAVTVPDSWDLRACYYYYGNIRTAFDIEITEAEYDEIWAAWNAMMGKA